MPDTSFEEGARRVFRDQVRALSPATLLDVGCGQEWASLGRSANFAERLGRCNHTVGTLLA